MPDAPWAMEPDAVDAAAANLRQQPHGHLDLALKYLQNDCHLNPVAFGVVGSAIVRGSYETSRAAIEQNLSDGIDRLKEMVEGLEEAAADARATDEASVIRPPDWLELDYEAPSGGGWRAGQQGGIIAGEGGLMVAKIVFDLARTGLLRAALLQPVNHASAAVLGASAKLAPPAIIATVLWALFTPLDPDIKKVIDAWGMASQELNNVDINESLIPLDGNWQGEDRNAFLVWANRYQAAVDDAVANASDNAAALSEVVGKLEELQLAFFAIAAAHLFQIISLEILSKLPYVGPVFKVIQQVLGVVLAAITGKAVATVGSTLLLLRSGMPLLNVKFADLKVNRDGGVGFEGLNDFPELGPPEPGS